MSTIIEDRFIDIKEVSAMVRLAEPTIWQKVRNGVFPCGCKLGRARRWKASEIQAFVTSGGVM